MLALRPPLRLNLLVADCLRMFLMKLNKKNMASQQERGFGVSYLEIAIAQDCLGYMPHIAGLIAAVNQVGFGKAGSNPMHWRTGRRGYLA